jgi:hypothetical protein
MTDLMDCAAPRHDLEPAPAEPAAWLCAPCRRHLQRHLRRIPGLYAQLDLTPARTPGGGRGHGDGLPYSDPVSECRSQIRHDLRYWTMHIATTRRCGYPQFTIPAMAGWLSGHVTWASFRDWAGDMAGAISSDHGRAMWLLDPRHVVRIERRTMRCGCGGQLTFTISDDESLAECRSCGTVWEPAEWMRLRRTMTTTAALAA